MDHERETRDGDRRDERARPRRGGGEHQFLDLEMSKVLADGASRLAREAFKELLLERIKDQIRERMSDKIDALARFAVDDMMADLEANLEVERRIEGRRESRDRSMKGLLRALADGDPNDAE